MNKVLTASVAAVLSSTMVQADDAGGAWVDDLFSEIKVSGDIGYTHDVRDRGLSITRFDPSYLLRVEASTAGGLFAGLTSSLVDNEFIGDVRAKAYLGYGFDAGAYRLDTSFNLDSFWGVSDQTRDLLEILPEFSGQEEEQRFFPELEVGISRDFGLAYFRSSFTWAPEGRWSALGSANSYYFATDIEVPVPLVPSLTILGHVGYDILDERNSITEGLGNDINIPDRFDWSVGLSYFWRDFEATVQYTDSEESLFFDDGRVVATLRYYF